MKVSGTSVLHAPPERVWQAINDPEVLAGVIPGCDSFREIGDDHFAMTVTLGVAAIKGSYTGQVRLYDKQEPESLTMHAAGAGGPGTIDTTVAVTLTDGHDGTTTLAYDADAIVGGMVGGVGQRVLTSVARKTAGKFFEAIDEVLTGVRPVGGRQAVGEIVGIETTELIQQTDGFVPAGLLPSRPGPMALIGAAAFGAISMLAGVLVGARIAGRR